AGGAGGRVGRVGGRGRGRGVGQAAARGGPVLRVALLHGDPVAAPEDLLGDVAEPFGRRRVRARVVRQPRVGDRRARRRGTRRRGARAVLHGRHHRRRLVPGRRRVEHEPVQDGGEPLAGRRAGERPPGLGGKEGEV